MTSSSSSYLSSTSFVSEKLMFVRIFPMTHKSITCAKPLHFIGSVSRKQPFERFDHSVMWYFSRDPVTQHKTISRNWRRKMRFYFDYVCTNTKNFTRIVFVKSILSQSYKVQILCWHWISSVIVYILSKLRFKTWSKTNECSICDRNLTK